MSLLIDKHKKFFQLCLHSLPAQAQSEDANKLALVYFVLHGLGLLGQFHTDKDTHLHVEYVYSHLIHTKNKEIQAFRSSQTFQLDEKNNEFDLPNLSATFFALAILLILEDDYTARLDKHKVMKFVQKCQLLLGQDKGSFLPVLGTDGQPWGELDLRLCYIAASIRKMVGYDQLKPEERESDIDVDSAVEFILDKINFNGGMASSAYTESHSGLTFCGVAALRLLGYDIAQDERLTKSTKNWLVHRQVDYPPEVFSGALYEYYDKADIGGFNGRENKFADTCYSWWVMGLLENIEKGALKLVSGEKVVDYLLNGTQHKLMGGFGKDTEARPDPFHSFLGIASLSLLKSSGVEFEGSEKLEEVDPELVITKKLRQFMDEITRRKN